MPASLPCQEFEHKLDMACLEQCIVTIVYEGEVLEPADPVWNILDKESRYLPHTGADMLRRHIKSNPMRSYKAHRTKALAVCAFCILSGQQGSTSSAPTTAETKFICLYLAQHVKFCAYSWQSRKLSKGLHENIVKRVGEARLGSLQQIILGQPDKAERPQSWQAT